MATLSPHADADAFHFQPFCDLQGAAVNGAVVGAMDRPLDGARDDFTAAVVKRRMVQNLVAKQRPFLHQSEHVFSSLVPDIERTGLFGVWRAKPRNLALVAVAW